MKTEKKTCKFNLAEFARNLHIAKETSDTESEKELKESFEKFIRNNETLKEDSIKYLKNNKDIVKSNLVGYIESL